MDFCATYTHISHFHRKPKWPPLNSNEITGLSNSQSSRGVPGGGGVGGTHVPRYLPEDVSELLLFLSFLVSVSRPWLWRHKGKLVHRDPGGGQSCEDSSFWAEGAIGPQIALGGTGAGSSTNALPWSNPLSWNEGHLGPSDPSSLHTFQPRRPSQSRYTRISHADM